MQQSREAGTNEACFVPRSRIGLPANPWNSEHRATQYLARAVDCADVSR